MKDTGQRNYVVKDEPALSPNTTKRERERPTETGKDERATGRRRKERKEKDDPTAATGP